MHARRWILLGLVAAATAVWASSARIVNLVMVGSASAPAAKYYTPSAAGGTVDTLRVLAGHVNGVADDGTVTIASGLDTSMTYDVHLVAMIAGQTVAASYAINMAVAQANKDTTRCNFCDYSTANCTGTTGSDVHMTLCNPASGATRNLIAENRLGSAADISWRIYAGGQ